MKKYIARSRLVLWLCLLWSQAAEVRLSVVMQRQARLGFISQGSAERAIVEADIIQLDGGRLSALSASGSVSVVDVSTPGLLALLGQTRLGGTFEMYRRGNLLITMWDGAISSTGSTVPPRPEPDYQQYRIPSRSDPNSGAAVVVLDMTNPKAIINLVVFRFLASWPIPAWWAMCCMSPATKTHHAIAAQTDRARWSLRLI